jgi:FixJ family two-component response regulator
MDYSRVRICFMFHVVDDEEIMRKVLVGMFKSFGFEVRAFGCPSEYIEHMNAPEYKSPTAIFSDVQMPNVNGYDFMHLVRQVNPTQKFVILSGTPEIEHNKKI